jgi:hypothetical protein
MKIPLITDIHYGVRNDNAAMLDSNKLFFDNVYFPYINEHDIREMIFLGDLLDRRKYVNFITAKRLREDFINPHLRLDCYMHLILGNHDVYFKNTNEVSGVKELCHRYSEDYDMRIYDAAADVKLSDGTHVLFVPWICDANREHTMKVIESTKAQICLGHLELKDFAFDRHTIAAHGDDASIFRKFDFVGSGHYHHISSQGNIHYLGAHAEFTWSDHKDPRGFHVFDTVTRELEFIENPYHMFEKLHYTDVELDMKEVLEEYDFTQLTNKYVKVVVRDRNDVALFNVFMDRVEKSNPLDIQVVDDHLNLNVTEDDTIVDEAEDTLTIFKKTISTTNTSGIDPIKLDKFISSLYSEALQSE